MPPPPKSISSSPSPPKSPKTYEFSLPPAIYKEPDDTTPVDFNARIGEARLFGASISNLKIECIYFVTPDYPNRKTIYSHSHLALTSLTSQVQSQF